MLRLQCGLCVQLVADPLLMPVKRQRHPCILCIYLVHTHTRAHMHTHTRTHAHTNAHM